MDDPQTPLGSKYLPLKPWENEFPYPDEMEEWLEGIKEPEWSKEELAHFAWKGAQVGLGKWLIEFQFLETAIKDAIAFLIDRNDLTGGRILTTKMRFIQLLNVLCALFAHRCKNEDEVGSLRGILKKCLECNERRNEFVHSFWYPEKDQGVAVRFEIRVRQGKQTYDESEEVVSGHALEREAEMYQRIRESL
jgi:hypothetical protein